MAPGRAREERKEWQWRRWISQWRASGLSVRAFSLRKEGSIMAPGRSRTTAHMPKVRQSLALPPPRVKPQPV
jgi:hypothetical protein